MHGDLNIQIFKDLDTYKIKDLNEKMKVSAQGVAAGAHDDRSDTNAIDLGKVHVEALGALFIANRKFWSNVDSVVTDAYDASTMGSPAEDTMLYALTEGTVGTWAAPMVHGPLPCNPHPQNSL